MLPHWYGSPTFKTKALRLVSNEGRLKRRLLQYKWLTLVFFGSNWQRILPFSFIPYDTLTFKTKALRLASIEGWVKRLLLLY